MTAEPRSGAGDGTPRSGASIADPHAAIDALATRFAEREEAVRAFLPEEGRWERLHREADALLAGLPPERTERPPLFGVLLGVKDVFRVAGFPTGAGSRLPPELFDGDEAPSVTALRAAGALVVGKTVSTEFAYFAPGATANPHDRERTPGGSSSGSAAAVAAGLCGLALGTQTIGSITRPASYCGVVGFKPTFGRVSTDGVVPLAPSLDHVGCFAPDVAGARAAAEVWLGASAGASALEQGTRPRLAVPIGPYLERADDEGRSHFAAAVERLRDAGYDVVDVPAMEDFSEIEARHRRIVAAEAAVVHALWFDPHRALYAPQTIELVERGRAIPAEQLREDLAGRGALRRQLEELLARRACDLWLTPAARGAAPLGLDSTGDPVMNLPWSHAGLPTVGLPAGRGAASRMPIGIQLAARAGADIALLDMARGLESALLVGGVPSAPPARGSDSARGGASE